MNACMLVIIVLFGFLCATADIEVLNWLWIVILRLDGFKLPDLILVIVFTFQVCHFDISHFKTLVLI